MGKYKNAEASQRLKKYFKPKTINYLSQPNTISAQDPFFE